MAQKLDEEREDHEECGRSEDPETRRFEEHEKRDENGEHDKREKHERDSLTRRQETTRREKIQHTNNLKV